MNDINVVRRTNGRVRQRVHLSELVSHHPPSRCTYVHTYMHAMVNLLKLVNHFGEKKHFEKGQRDRQTDRLDTQTSNLQQLGWSEV